MMKTILMGVFALSAVVSMQAKADLVPGKITFNGTLYVGPGEITTVVNPSVSLDGVSYAIERATATTYSEENAICKAFGLGAYSGMDTVKSLSEKALLIDISSGGFNFEEGAVIYTSISCHSH